MPGNFVLSSQFDSGWFCDLIWPMWCWECGMWLEQRFRQLLSDWKMKDTWSRVDCLLTSQQWNTLVCEQDQPKTGRVTKPTPAPPDEWANKIQSLCETEVWCYFLWSINVVKSDWATPLYFSIKILIFLFLWALGVNDKKCFFVFINAVIISTQLI